MLWVKRCLLTVIAGQCHSMSHDTAGFTGQEKRTQFCFLRLGTDCRKCSSCPDLWIQKYVSHYVLQVSVDRKTTWYFHFRCFILASSDPCTEVLKRCEICDFSPHPDMWIGSGSFLRPYDVTWAMAYEKLNICKCFLLQILLLLGVFNQDKECCGVVHWEVELRED